MNAERAKRLLEQVARGETSVAAAFELLAMEPAESLGFATLDHHRALRQGFPEVIFGQHKTAEQVVAITFQQNVASWGLMKRLGMTRRPELDYDDVRFPDLNPTIVYAIRREEWRG